jgi:hypothetical protein
MVDRWNPDDRSLAMRRPMTLNEQAMADAAIAARQESYFGGLGDVISNVANFRFGSGSQIPLAGIRGVTPQTGIGDIANVGKDMLIPLLASDLGVEGPMAAMPIPIIGGKAAKTGIGAAKKAVGKIGPDRARLLREIEEQSRRTRKGSGSSGGTAKERMTQRIEENPAVGAQNNPDRWRYQPSEKEADLAKGLGTGRPSSYWNKPPLERTELEWTTPRGAAVKELRDKGLSYSQIGKELDITPTAARGAYKKAEKDIASGMRDVRIIKGGPAARQRIAEEDQFKQMAKWGEMRAPEPHTDIDGFDWANANKNHVGMGKTSGYSEADIKRFYLQEELPQTKPSFDSTTGKRMPLENQKFNDRLIEQAPEETVQRALARYENDLADWNIYLGDRRSANFARRAAERELPSSGATTANRRRFQDPNAR